MTRDFTDAEQAPEAVTHLVGLLRDFEAATLITRTRAGGLHGRPMAIARVEENVTIWLVTRATSAKAEELAEDARAMVTLQANDRFVSINGRAELLFDAERLKELWKESYRVWHDGEAEAARALLRFTAFDAEYWDESGARGLKYVFQTAKAIVTGQKSAEKSAAEPEADAHARLRLWAPKGMESG